MGGRRIERRDLLRALRALGARPCAGEKGSHERWERTDGIRSFKTTIPQREEFAEHYATTIGRQLGLSPTELAAALER